MTNHMTTIGEIAQIYDGPHATPKKTNIGPYFLSISSLDSGRLDLSKSAHLSEKDFITWTKRVTPQEGDLLFSYETRLGEAALMPGGIKSCLGRRMGLLRPDPDRIISEYLLYEYLSPHFQQIISQNTIVGATVNRIALSEMSEYPIHVPPLAEQELISTLLVSIDKKIALNNKINTELEAMAKLIYDYWFVQFDFPDANGKPYKSSGGKMVYNEALKREIPEGWSVEELNQCVDTILDHRGKTPKKLGGDWTDNDDGIIALSAKLVKGGKLRNLEKANKVDRALFNKWMPEKLKDGDILMTSEAPAGEFYFIHGKTDYCMSQRLFGIRGKQELLAPTYLYYELSKGHGYSQILGSLSGSTVFGIRQDVLRTIKVVVPELALQKRFDEIVLPQLKQIKNLDQANIELSALRDWLLPMLMNGQVTVKDTAS